MNILKPIFFKSILLLSTVCMYAIPAGAGSLSGSAQGKGSITGTIKVKETQQVVEYATVSLFLLADSSLSTGTLTGAYGTFTLQDVPFGKYFIQVKFLGFKTATFNDVVLSKEQPFYVLDDIELEAATEQLEGVEIAERQNQVTFKLDKQVVTVGEDNAVAGGTAIQILENTPSIQTDVNGDLTLRGSSNFTVLIDGKPSVLSGNEALRQIPASSIDYIEIITNPSAKYDAEGTAGIVNVVLKKGEKGNGSSGFVELSSARYNSNQTNLMFSQQRSKMSWSAGLSYQNSPTLGSNEMNRVSFAPDTLWYQESQMDREWFRSGTVAKAGVDYQLSEAASLSASFQAGSRVVRTSSNSVNHEYTIPFFQDDEYLRNYSNENIGNYINTSVLFSKSIAEGEKLSFDVQYSSWSGNHSVGFDESLTGTSVFDELESREESERQTVRLSADYVKSLGEKLSLETGLRTRLQTSESAYDVWEYQPSSETSLVNPLLAQRYGFNQWVHAAYGTISGAFSKFNYMLGLRAEYGDRSVTPMEGNGSYEQQNFNFFPSVHVSRAFGTIQTKASFSRRINRPQEWSLYPYITYIDPYNLKVGNPDLNPDYTNSYEIGITKSWSKGFLSIELYHRNTDEAVNRVRELQEDNTVLETPFNIASKKATGLESMWNLRPVSWFNMNLSARLYDFRFNGNLEDGTTLETQTLTWNTSASLNFYLPWDFHFQTTGFYYAPSVGPQGSTGSFGSVTMRLNKGLFKKSLTASFEVRDVFKTMRHAFTYSDAAFELNNQFRFAPQIYKLTVSYRFNKFNSTKVRTQLDKTRIDLEPSSFE